MSRRSVGGASGPYRGVCVRECDFDLCSVNEAASNEGNTKTVRG